MIVKLDHIRKDPSGVLIYRRKFPKALVAFIPSAGPSGWGRKEFKVSLRTKDINAPGTAQRHLDAKREFDAIVAAAQRTKVAHQKRATGAFDDLDGPTIAALAARYHATELAADEARRKDPARKEDAREAARVMRQAGFEFPTVPDAAEWTLSIRKAHETIREAARAMRAIGDTEGIASCWSETALSIASDAGHELRPGGHSHTALCEALNDAAIAASEDALRRLDGDHVPTPVAPEVPRGASRAGQKSARTLGDLIDAYKADRADKWSTSSTTGFVPVERVMREVLGPNRPLSEIGRDEGRELFEVVKRLPKGLGTLPALRGLSVADAIELGLPGLSPKSINGTYLSSMKAVFKFALQEQWMATSPMLGLSVVDPVHEADKRDPFTIDQLNAVFSGAPWSPRDDAPRGKPLHFWGPLIALFLGMRRSEIAQLQVADVVEVAGVNVILVKSGSGKRTKTKNARRMLPVHPELVRLGFLEYVGTRRSARALQLWEGEAPNNNDQWGDGFSDWFLRLLKDRKVAGTKLGLHALRHNFQDALREAGLHGTSIGQELAGRSKGGDTSDNYGSQHPTRQLAEAVAKVAYPGLTIRWGPQP